MAEICEWSHYRPNIKPSRHGWLHSSVQDRLSAHLNGNIETVVEIGSWLGRSTRFICDHAVNAVVYAVDTWEGSEEHHRRPEWAKMLPGLYEKFLTSCWEYQE